MSLPAKFWSIDSVPSSIFAAAVALSLLLLFFNEDTEKDGVSIASSFLHDTDADAATDDDVVAVVLPAEVVALAVGLSGRERLRRRGVSSFVRIPKPVTLVCLKLMALLLPALVLLTGQCSSSFSCVLFPVPSAMATPEVSLLASFGHCVQIVI